MITITDKYYAGLLEWLKGTVKEKRRGKWTKGVLLLHDNMPVHESSIALAALHNCGFQMLNPTVHSYL